MDTIKTRLQTTNNYRGIMDCFTKMVRTEGPRFITNFCLRPRAIRAQSTSAHGRGRRQNVDL